MSDSNFERLDGARDFVTSSYLGNTASSYMLINMQNMISWSLEFHMLVSYEVTRNDGCSFTCECIVVHSIIAVFPLFNVPYAYIPNRPNCMLFWITLTCPKTPGRKSDVSSVNFPPKLTWENTVMSRIACNSRKLRHWLHNTCISRL